MGVLYLVNFRILGGGGDFIVLRVVFGVLYLGGFVLLVEAPPWPLGVMFF